MDRDDDGVLEAARAIRPYLSDFLDPALAGTLDRRIANQLADPAASVTELRSLLEEQEDTAWFLRRVLSDKWHRPPYQQPPGVRDPVSPGGDPALIEADRYSCPRGDYVRYRPEVGSAVPDCPTHGISLIRG